MPGENISCPSCGALETQLVGDIPASDIFAGTALQIPLKGGNLYHCPTCFLSFRHPQISNEKLSALYSKGDELHWQHRPGQRKDWEIARLWITERFSEGSKVLDIGCFDGGFLEELGNSFTRYGIEMHKMACERAMQKGIDIIGHDINLLSSLDCTFDVAVAFDVIEHMDDPRDFLKLLASAVRPGGMVIVATGNTLAPSWRFMGSRYWYCTNAEHISFINPIWCNLAASLCGLEVKQMQNFSHIENLSLGNVYRVKEILRNIFYRCAPWAAAGLRMMGAGKRRIGEHPELAYQPPSWMSAKDHFMTNFRKM